MIGEAHIVIWTQRSARVQSFQQGMGFGMRTLRGQVYLSDAPSSFGQNFGFRSSPDDWKIIPMCSKLRSSSLNYMDLMSVIS